MSTTTLTDLRVEYYDRATGGHRVAVDGVSLDLEHGRLTGLVGASGSGKSTIGRALLGVLAEQGRVTSGILAPADGDALIDLDDSVAVASLRGRRIALIPQDPFVSLSPLRRVGAQLVDALRRAHGGTRADHRAEAVRLLDEVGIDRPTVRVRQYPHELSGGMRQRVLIALALATRARVIVADEPTSALDATVQRQILDLLTALAAARDIAVLFISHDLSAVLSRAPLVYVLREGRITDRIDTDLLSAGEIALSDYGTALLRAGDYAFAREHTAAAEAAAPIVEIRSVGKVFTLPGRGTLTALDDVTLKVAPGSFFAVVGESGSGKSTLARAILGLTAPSTGEILVDGRSVSRADRASLARLRRDVQYVYQDPFGSLDPRLTVGDILLEPLRAQRRGNELDRKARVLRAIEQVDLPSSFLARRAAELSGGQRQRVAIARALVLEPRVLVLDEAVSALDMIVQEQIIVLLLELQRAHSLTYVFVSHDLRLVRHIADHVAVLSHGAVVDEGPMADVFEHPTSEHTRALLAAIPVAPLARPHDLAQEKA